ncbi:MAG: FHA domain-containing protein [Planctomycetota bacterium]|nr:FHA domain-containing protein [Planctomycetota bacterium]
MKIHLEARAGRGQTISTEIESAVITIGSGAGCEFAVVGDGLDFTHVSEQHAKIELSPGGATLTDLSSEKGTWINGRSVQKPMSIRAGTRFTLGRLGPTVTVRSLDLSVPVPQPELEPAALRRSRRPLIAAAIVLLAVVGGAIGYFYEPTINPGEFTGGDGDHFAIVIAVEDYPDTQPLADLEYAEEDAVRLARALHEKGYDVSLMVQSVRDEEHLQTQLPTAANIRREFKEILNPSLNQKLDGNDTIVVALIGQSVHFETGSSEGSLFFCPANASVTGLKTADQVSAENNLISIEKLYETLNEASKARVKFLYYDTARLDPTNPPDPETVQVTSLPQVPVPPGNVVALFSSEAGEQSHVDATLRAGVSAHFLASAIAGNAEEAAISDGELSLQEVAASVRKNTTHHVSTYLKGLRQQPELRGSRNQNNEVLVRLDSKRGGDTSPKVGTTSGAGSNGGTGDSTKPVVSTNPGTGTSSEHQQLAKRAEAFLSKYCAKCHSDDTYSSLENVLDYATLRSDNGNGTYITPGSLEQSLIWARVIQQDKELGDPMPPPDNEEGVPIPSDDERKVIEEWILAGAPSFASTPTAASGDNAGLALQAKGFLQKYCVGCHGDKTIGGFANAINHDLLLSQGKKGAYVTRQQPSESRIWIRINNATMPPKNQKDRPTEQEQDVIHQWILAGAPAWKTVPPRKPVTQKTMLDVMASDLRRLSGRERRDRRYLTLTHLHNNSFSKRVGQARVNISGQELRLVRAATSKIINSLTWEPTVSVPSPLDENKTVLAINLRDYGWSEADWDELVENYPFGVRLDAHPSDDDVAKLAEDVFRLSSTKLPFIQADWFVNNAARPEHYFDLLDLPNSIQELEKKLGVDPDQDFLDSRLVRSAFNESGVSVSNRLVDRHDSRIGPGSRGYYWKSYDFAKSEGKGKLTGFPLGPKFRNNPFSEFAFEADGGEMVFSLPNGMQGYYLSDIEGNRLPGDKGPTDVVRDLNETAGSIDVVCGLSCMHCHARGMIRDFKDTVRGAGGMTGDALKKVREIYVTDDEMQDWLAKDEELFMTAARKATGLFLNEAEIQQSPESIGTVARSFQKDLGLEEAAAELFVTPESLQNAILGSQTLKDLGLGPLQKGQPIKRSQWESRSVSGKPTVFQQAALQVLGLDPID